MQKKENTEKTAVAKLRERFYEIKRSIKPSEKLKELLRQEPKPDEDDVEEEDKKVARPRSTRNEVDL